MATEDLNGAIARIQDIVDAITTVKFKSFPDFPIENASAFPMSIAYLAGGQFHAVNATMLLNFPVINVECHFSRVSLEQAYTQINAVAKDLPKRLAADPTLNATVETIVFSGDQPISYTVRPYEWGKVTSQMLLFAIPVKMLQTPST